MGIENLGNNQFGKLAAQNYNKSKAQENAVDLTNNQIKNTTTKGVNLNKGTLQAGQKDLTASFIDKIVDIDDGKLGKNEPEVKTERPLTEKEKGWLREMQNEGVKDPEWAAGAAVCFIVSRIYHRIKGD